MTKVRDHLEKTLGKWLLGVIAGATLAAASFLWQMKADIVEMSVNIEALKNANALANRNAKHISDLELDVLKVKLIMDHKE